jgi:hypothetical protein
MVCPLLAPQVPSFVVEAVAVAPGGDVEVTGCMTGSPLLVGVCAGPSHPD